MKRIHLLIIIAILLFSQSCKKDDATEQQIDYTSFTNSTQYSFNGLLQDTSYLWQYGLYMFQRGNSSMPTAINEQAAKKLGFWLTSNSDLTTRFNINTPTYLANTDDLFTKVLSVGEKELGNKPNNPFSLSLTLNNKVYSTFGDQTNSHLKVLKIAKSTDEFNRDIVNVWFIANCKFYDVSNNNSITLLNGKFLVCFMYNL